MMKIKVLRKNDDFLMEAANETGNTLLMDAAETVGGENGGFRPTQLLLAAVGGCSSIDVLLILKKQKQNIEHFEVSVEAEKIAVEDHSEFREIILHFIMRGQIDAAKARRAIELSLEKYCSVSKILEKTAQISYKLTLN